MSFVLFCGIWLGEFLVSFFELFHFKSLLILQIKSFFKKILLVEKIRLLYKNISSDVQGINKLRKHEIVSRVSLFIT